MPCVKSGARAGSLYRNLVAHALTLGASGDRAPVRQQPCLVNILINKKINHAGYKESQFYSLPFGQAGASMY